MQVIIYLCNFFNHRLIVKKNVPILVNYNDLNVLFILYYHVTTIISEFITYLYFIN